MHVTVDQARHDRGAVELDDLGPRAAVLADLIVAARRRDLPVTDADRGRARAVGIERADAGADEGEIEVGGHGVSPWSGAGASAARRVGFHPGRGTEALSIRV